MTANCLTSLEERGLAKDGAPLRLHLGCGEQHLDGYVNIDYPGDEHNVMKVRPDLEMDVTALAFPPATVDEIRLHHVFEHFPRVAALGLLIRWHSWLKLGGRLHLEVPDLEGSAQTLLSNAPYRHRSAAVRHLIGDQSAAWAFHVELWFPERLVRTLRALGFSARVETRKWAEPPHLANLEVVATKEHELTEAELVALADELLWDSTVAAAERPTWEVWRSQLRAFLAFEPGSGPRGLTYPAAPGPAEVTALVFSKDRPLQLEATLRSLVAHCRDRQHAAITVLYLATTPRMQALYDVLREEYPSIEFRAEKDYASDVREIVARRPAVLFLVDDTLFVGDFALAEALSSLSSNPDALGFSLRLGPNVTSVYALGKPQPQPSFEAVSAGVLAFNWKQAQLAFAYPLEVSSSLYRSRDITALLNSITFNNPNTLEARLSELATPTCELPRRLLCYRQSVAFSAPLNVVQDVFKNRASARTDYGVDALADAFAAGDRIDVMAYRDVVPNDCHAEIEIIWRRGARPALASPPASRPGLTSTLALMLGRAARRFPAMTRVIETGAVLLDEAAQAAKK